MFTLLLSAELKYLETIETSEPYQMGHIVADDNHLFVTDLKGTHIVRLDKRGKVLQEFGDRGEGPGEVAYISGFTMTTSQFIIAGSRRIVVFSKDGKPEALHKTKHLVNDLFSTADTWYYVLFVRKRNKEKNSFEDLYDVRNERHQSVYHFPDETLQRAYNVKKGARLPFAWFPSPFCNRPYYPTGLNGKAALFLSRQKDFLLFQKDKPVKVTIQASLPQDKVTDKDKRIFFENITPKPHKKTRESVVFPDIKDYYMGVIQWDNGWALITNKEIIIIGETGNELKRLPIPGELKPFASTHFPSSWIYKHGNRLYVIDFDEGIMVFSTT
jgi:hypothetical protein